MVCWIASYKILFDRDTSIRTDSNQKSLWNFSELNINIEKLGDRNF